MSAMLWPHFPIILLSLLDFNYAEYVIVTTPSKLEIGITKNVTLDCHFIGLLDTTSLYSISRIRIMKDIGSENFEIVAEARESESGAHNLGLSLSANVTGHVSSVQSSYISISWDVASRDILGNYRCDIVGFKANQDVILEKTPVIVLKESILTLQDLLDLSVKQKADIQRQIHAQNEYCDKQVISAELNITDKILSAENEQNNSRIVFQDSVLSQLVKLTANIKRLKDTGVFQYWPEGSYGLLMPDSGCPISVGALWSIGYRRFHTESIDRNYDSISPSSHLQTPTTERIANDNFMYQHFCISRVRSPGSAWPKGSYCINRAGDICPSGFDSGFTAWQDEVTNSKASYSGFLPDGVYTANSTRIYYCCRADGSPSNPVYLPKNRPFYLYRYNGTCQQVSDMTISPGDMTFDTDSSNGDAFENKYHPDGAINNVHIELCYYSQ